MRVIPADNFLLRVLRLHDALNVAPGFGGESHLGVGAAGKIASDHRFHEQERAGLVAVDIANQHAADFHFGGGRAVAVDGVEHRAA